jgi:hypothetical protein
VVFASGAIVGAFAHRLYMVQSVQSVREAAETARDPQEYRKRYLAEMRTRLSLTPEQETALNDILDDTRVRYRELHERFRPEMKAIQNEQTDKINAILNPRQQTEYEKMREEREQRRKKDQNRSKYGL